MASAISNALRRLLDEQTVPVDMAPAPAAAVSPTAAIPDFNPDDFDHIVRTVWGEARSEDPQGQQAVASVILNRSRQSGRTPRQVVLERNQFEPWSRQRAALDALDPTSPDYQRIAANIAPALAGEDPTGGADSFYSPRAQEALGRNAPSWDDGTGVDLGNHRFFRGLYTRRAPASEITPTDPLEAAAAKKRAEIARAGSIFKPDEVEEVSPVSPASKGAAAPFSMSEIEEVAPQQTGALTQNLKEAAKGIIPGAMEMGGGMLRGAAADMLPEPTMRAIDKWVPQLKRVPSMTAAEREGLRQKIALEPDPQINAVAGDIFQSIVEGRFDPATLGPVVKRPAAELDLAQSPIYRAGQSVSEVGKTIMPAAPGYESSPGRIVGEGLGSMLAGIPLAGLSRGLGGLSFSLSGSGQAADEAIRQGRSPEEIQLAANAGLGPGLTDVAPVEALLERMHIPVLIRSKLAKAIGKIGIQATIEGIQEGGQQFLQNMIERDVYNPKQELGEDVLPNAAAGSGVGAIAETGAQLLERMMGGKAHGGRRTQTQPAPAASAAAPVADDAAILQAAGYAPADIADMSQEEVRANATEARRQGVTATPAEIPLGQMQGAARPRFTEDGSTPDQPSAEPIGDLAAQIADMAAPDNPRQGMYLAPDTMKNLTTADFRKMDEASGGKGVIVPNFDGKGGMLVVESQDVADVALRARDEGVPLQTILGALTGAGVGKAPGADTVVQQVTPEGAVTRETAVRAEEAPAAAENLAAPGRTVRTVAPEEALQRREAEIASPANQVSRETQAPQVDVSRAAASSEVAQAQPFSPDEVVAVGTRQAPSRVAEATDMAHAEANVAEPTPAQAEAGNYQKGHLRWNGLPITIETAKGGVRRGNGPKGEAWEVTMPVTYGYIKRSTGADGEQVDVSVGPNPQSDRVFLIDQIDPDTGKYDEAKVMVGFDSEGEARTAYEGSFAAGGRPRERVGAVSELSVDGFKKWLKSGRGNRAYDNKALKGIRDRYAQQGVTEKQSPEWKYPILSGIRKTGGVDPESPLAGELRQMGVTNRTLPGLFKAGGVGAVDNWVKSEHDAFRDMADDGNGYIPQETVLEAIRSEMFGQPWRAPEDATDTGKAEQKADDIALDAALREWGLENDGAVRAAAKALMGPGVDPEAAIERAMMTVAEEELTNEELGTVSEESGIPFDLGAAGAESSAVAEQPREERASEPQAGAPEERGAVRPAGEPESKEKVRTYVDIRDSHGGELFGTVHASRDGKVVGHADFSSYAKVVRVQMIEVDPAYRRQGIATAIMDALKAEFKNSEIDWGTTTEEGEAFAQSVERTAAGPQQVIPGAERIGQGEQAQRAADKPLKPKVAQKSVEDTGLFGDSAAQTDLVDMARKPALARDSEENSKPPTSETVAPEGRSVDVQPEDSDEELSVTLTAEPPWDFNDTYPDVDHEKVDAREAEGRYDLEDGDGGTRDAVQIQALIEETIGELQIAFLDMAEARKRITTIESGKATLKRNQSAEKEIKRLRDAIGVEMERVRGTSGALQDIFSPRATAAIIREARLRAKTERRQTDQGVDRNLPDERAAKEEKAVPPSKAAASPEAPSQVWALRDHFVAGKGFGNILAARKFAREHGAPNATNKQLDEYVEQALVLAARQIAADKEAGLPAYQALVDLYGRQPILGSRTSKSMVDQAYSTPAPLAYIASRQAGVADTKGEIYEPTAGNGMLLIEADPAHTLANEIDPMRNTFLHSADFGSVGHNDASEWSPMDDGGPPEFSVVLANPPFGAVRDEGRSKMFGIDGWMTTQIDHVIALRALKAMKDDGRAVLLLGGVNPSKDAREGYSVKQKREFYFRLYRDYNVVDHFTVAGDLYQKQGAGWPVDVVVIDGRGKSARALPAADIPKVYSTWAELEEKVNVSRGVPAVANPEDRGTYGEPLVAEQRPASGDERGGKTAGRRGTVERIVPDAAVAADLREGGDLGEPAAEGASEQPGAGVQPDRGGDAGRSGERASVPRQPRVASTNAAGQSTYQAQSQANDLGTLIPVNMRDATRRSLESVARKNGDIDTFVASELGYPREELSRYFVAEQIDGIALAIDNVQRGAGVVIGDQTGIGKGRQVAAMIRYAMRNDMLPIFVTQAPDLYGDMQRDLTDIGMPDVRVLMTNVGEKIPLDDEALAWKLEYDEAKAAGNKTPPQRGRFFTGGTRVKQERDMAALAAGEDVADVLFTTYSQMNTVKGKDPARRGYVRSMIGRSFLMMDESHEAGGQGETRKAAGAPQNRAEFFRDLVTDAKAVLYSSATYAKRPDVMDLYKRTDMALAVENPKQLPELISRGGVPLQQIVASMLAESGQYIRRERSFEGVDYGVEGVPIDQDTYAGFTSTVNAIFSFDLAVADVRKKLMKQILAVGGQAQGMDNAIGEMAANATEFSSIMHNLIGQMILSIKADKIADRAIKAFKEGEKPVVTLANTMESFVNDYADDRGIKTGDDIPITFADVLKRYLSRALRITIKNPEGPNEYLYIKPEELGPTLERQYHAVEDIIDSVDFHGLPLSSIDHIRNRLTKAGVRVAEITGRGRMIDYAGNMPKLIDRPKREIGPSGKRATIAAFNRGDLDAVILNKSGSTGVSLHASAKSDKKPRRMIIAQADPNIDVHMQTLGRIHRTGQVVLPRYTQAVAEIPAEVRPTAVLLKKMASLSANTTGARKSAFSADAADFMNAYGDEVAVAIIADDPALELKLGNPLKIENDGYVRDGAMRRLTGRIVMLQPAEQQELLDKLQSNYAAVIAELDALGENALEAKSIDLQARPIDAMEIRERKGDSPFLDSAQIERMSVKSPGRAMAPDEIVENILEKNNITGAMRGQSFGDRLAHLVQMTDRHFDAQFTRVAAEWDKMQRLEIGGLKDPEARARHIKKADAAFDRFRTLHGLLRPGRRVTIKGASSDTPAVVMELRSNGKTKNPAALGSWQATFAIPDSSRTLTVNLSRLFTENDKKGDDERGFTVGPATFTDDPKQLAAMFEKAKIEGRQDRYILTGNILAGYDAVGGRGQIANFTMEDGGVRPGILMPQGFDLKNYMASRPVRLTNGKQVVEFLKRSTDGEVSSIDTFATMRRIGPDRFEIDMPAGRATGGRYFLEPDIRAAVGEFEKRGNRMRAEVNGDQLRRAVEAMIRFNAVFETRSDQDAAAEIVRANPSAPRRAMATTAKPVPGLYSAVVRAVENAKLSKGTADQWLGYLRNQPGVKQEEMDWLGVGDWLGEQSGAVTKEALADFARANQVTVTETEKGSGEQVLSADEALGAIDRGVYDVFYRTPDVGRDDGRGPLDADDIEALRNDSRITFFVQKTGDDTKFASYQLPGGENYRELLLTLPDTGANEQLAQKWFGQPYAALAHSERDFVIREAKTEPPAGEFRSSHWDEPNVLAHVRFNERDVGGKRVLFIEEVQSDWHQAGRKRGYGGDTAAKQKRRGELQAQWNAHIDADTQGRPEGQAVLAELRTLNGELATAGSGGVPDAPFKTTWPELALKRMIRWAAENGFDEIAWTPGDVQAERYDLSKHIGSVLYTNEAGKWWVTARAPDNRRELIHNQPMDERELENNFGKEVAEKIIKGEGRRDGTSEPPEMVLSGLDLKVGGEGMKGFYDRILPAAANKLGKKFGAKVGTLQIPAGTSEAWGIKGQDFERVHALPITPAMRSAALDGQPLFQSATTPTDRLRNAAPDPVALDRLENDIRSIIGRMLGSVAPEVRFRARLPVNEYMRPEEMAGMQEYARQRGEALNETIGGGYLPGEDLILIALQDPLYEPRTTAWHEAFHHFETALATANEQKLLLSEMPRLRRLAAVELGMAPDDPAIAAMPDIEVTATAFQRYARLRDEGIVAAGFHIGLRRLYDRLAQIIRQIGRYLTRRGVTRFEDLFEQVRTGKMAGREVATTATEPRAAVTTTNTPVPAAQTRAPVSIWTQRANRTLRRVGDISDMTRIKIQDDKLALRRVQEAIEQETGVRIPENVDTYGAAGLFPGRAGERTVDLKTDHVEPLVQAMQEADVKRSQLDDFLYARHHKERRNEALARNPDIDPNNPANASFGSGMTDDEARAIIGRIRAAGQLDTYKALAARVDAMIAASRATMLRAGLISKETFDEWEAQYRYYVPLRSSEADEPDRPRVGRGFSVRGPEAMAMTGRRSKADSPLAYSIMQAEQAIIRAEKNRVDQTFLRFVRSFPDPDMWQIAKAEMKKRVNPTTGLVETYAVPPAFSRADNLLAVKIGGKTTFVEIKHRPTARAMVRAGMVDHYGPLLRAAMVLARTYSKLVTQFSPEFAVTNVIRDMQTALLNVSDVQGKPEGVRRQIVKDALSLKSIRGILRALSDPTRRGEVENYFNEYRLAGGKISFINMNDVDVIQKKIDRMLNSGRARQALSDVAQLVENVGTAAENGARLSTYIALRKAGFTQDRAATVARELTVNFNRHGEWGPVLNTAYLFFNASLQGATRMAQAATRSRVVRRAIGAIFLAGLGLDWLNYLLAGDDPDGENYYDKIPDWEKERNLIIMWPGAANGKYLKIPLAYGYNIPFFAGQQMMATLRGHTKPLAAAWNVTSGMFDVFNPLGSAPSFAQFASPTLLDPVIQVTENQTWFGAPVAPKAYDDNKPDSETYFASAPDWAKSLARTLNSATGGNVGKKGLIDVSPETLELYAEFAGGGVSKFALNAWKTGENLVDGDPWEPEKTPFVRRLYGEYTEADRRGQFYDLWDEIDAARYEAKALEKAANVAATTGDQAEAAALATEAQRAMRDNSAEIGVWKAFDQARKALTEFAAERRALDKQASSPERTQTLDLLDKQEADLIRGIVAEYRTLKRQQAGGSK